MHLPERRKLVGKELEPLLTQHDIEGRVWQVHRYRATFNPGDGRPGWRRQGTGVNLTPPPPDILSGRVVQHVRTRIECVAQRLGLRGYARIDAFVERRSGRVMVIEANTLPALTPSTVLFHQGLAESPPLMPRELLELLIEQSYPQ